MLHKTRASSPSEKRTRLPPPDRSGARAWEPATRAHSGPSPRVSRQERRTRPHHPRTAGRMAPAVAPVRVDQARTSHSTCRRRPAHLAARRAHRTAERLSHAKPRFWMVSHPRGSVLLTLIRVYCQERSVQSGVSRRNPSTTFPLTSRDLLQ